MVRNCKNSNHVTITTVIVTMVTVTMVTGLHLRYEVIKKGTYVFLVVKEVTKADRGQYVLAVRTHGKNLVAYFIMTIEGTS